jgi:dTDP-4-amino-4,6-dideoxygalactose transaminase
MIRPTFLQFALPDIGEEELHEVREVLESGWLSTGPKAHRFEQEFAARVGARYAVAVNSCTAAMHLGLEAIGLQPGDFVFTTPYTFAATAEVIRYFDAVPVFVDVEPDTLNIDPRELLKTMDDLDRWISDGRPPETVAAVRAVAPSMKTGSAHRGRRGRRRAVIPVHIAGHPAEIDTIACIASEYRLGVLEDAAHACSASFRERPIGGPIGGDAQWAACFSFYATKTLATGEGGMITTDSETQAERYRVMRLHGISKDAWKRYTAEGSWYYEIAAPGYKYNMPDVLAAIGLAQLRKVERMRGRREQIARRYTEAFGGHAALQVPSVRPHVEHAWHLYMLRLNAEHLTIGRDAFIQQLKNRNIGASVHFIPLHVHPYYEAAYGYTPKDFPVAYAEYQREISLPIYSKMTDADVEYVIDAVSDVVTTFRVNSEFDRESFSAIAGR